MPAADPRRSPRATLVSAVLLALAVWTAVLGHPFPGFPAAGANERAGLPMAGPAQPVVEQHPSLREIVQQLSAPQVTQFATAQPPAPAPAQPTAVASLVPTVAPNLPSGKGMWIYEPARTEGGNPAAIVAKAKAAGLTHLWVRMGSAWDGFNVAPFMDRLLPAAHAANLKVIGWDFPKLDPWENDIKRALTMVHFTSASGDRIDAFSADIETKNEGTHLTADAARRYGEALRAGVGSAYPLIATVPRPSPGRADYPYADVVASYDAIAPMVYWLNRQPDSDVIGAVASLAKFGKPVFPVGQAYDGSPEGGRKGVPPPDELFRFMRAAEAQGVSAVSFWSWQAADQRAWNAIGQAEEFRPVPPKPSILLPIRPEFSP